MIIPIRCMTCGKVLADKWEYYKAAVEKDPSSAKRVLKELGLTRMCCCRHMLGHKDLIPII